MSEITKALGQLILNELEKAKVVGQTKVGSDGITRIWTDRGDGSFGWRRQKSSKKTEDSPKGNSSKSEVGHENPKFKDYTTTELQSWMKNNNFEPKSKDEEKEYKELQKEFKFRIAKMKGAVSTDDNHSASKTSTKNNGVNPNRKSRKPSSDDTKKDSFKAGDQVFYKTRSMEVKIVSLDSKTGKVHLVNENGVDFHSTIDNIEKIKKEVKKETSNNNSSLKKLLGNKFKDIEEIKNGFANDTYVVIFMKDGTRIDVKKDENPSAYKEAKSIADEQKAEDNAAKVLQDDFLDKYRVGKGKKLTSSAIKEASKINDKTLEIAISRATNQEVVNSRGRNPFNNVKVKDNQITIVVPMESSMWNRPQGNEVKDYIKTMESKFGLKLLGQGYGESYKWSDDKGGRGTTSDYEIVWQRPAKQTKKIKKSTNNQEIKKAIEILNL